MKRTKISRLLATATATVMLFSSMTVFAGAPSKADSPTWKDVQELVTYVGEKVYDYKPEYVDDVEAEIPHWEEGTYLVDSAKESTYDAYVSGDGSFTKEAQGEAADTDVLTGNAASQYSNFYDDAIALVGSVKQADGTKYVDDIIDGFGSFMEKEVQSIWDDLDSGRITVVDSEVDAPDTSTMKQGTYWVLASDLEAFQNAVNDVVSTSESWGDDGNGHFNSTRAEVEECIAKVKAAYNTLIDKLHEGEMESESKKSSKKKVAVDEQDSSENNQPAEETPAPVPTNEVTYSGGVKKQSGLEGEYCKTFMAGAIYTDGQKMIGQAAGLSEKEIADGVIIKCFICDSRNKTMNEILTKTGSAQGYKVLGVINNDLYKLYRGTVTPIRSTQEAVIVVLGVPEKLRSDQYEFAVICYDEKGNLVMMPDLDTDKATVTVQAKSFGAWAVLYRTRQQ